MLPRAAVAANDGDRYAPSLPACQRLCAKATTQRGSPLRRPRYRPRFARFARMAASSTLLGSKSGSSHSIALMVEMLRVRDRLQKGLIAHWSADIRRGTAALRTDEARITDAGRRCLDRLQLDRVSPIFPVHVVVPERFCEREHVGQRRRLGGARTRFRIIAIE